MQLAHAGFDLLFAGKPDALPRRHAQTLPQTDSDGLEDVFGSESTDLVDIAVYLAGAQSSRCRYLEELKACCQVEDSFLAQLSRRLYLLTRIHSAIEELRCRKKPSWSSLAPSNSNDATPSGCPECAVELGIRLLFVMVDHLLDKHEQPQLIKTFLEQINTLLGDLPPLYITEKTKSDERSLLSTAAVTDTARKIIIQCALVNVDLHPQSLRSPSASKLHSLAAIALVRMASARARASDLLCIVHGLLQRDDNFAISLLTKQKNCLASLVCCYNTQTGPHANSQVSLKAGQKLCHLFVKECYSLCKNSSWYVPQQLRSAVVQNAAVASNLILAPQ